MNHSKTSSRWRRWATMALVPSAVLIASLATVPAAETVGFPSLVGRWAVVMIMVGRGEIPFVGPGSVETTIGLLTDVEQDGERLVLHDAYCVIGIEMDPPTAVTSIPDLFMQALVPPPRFAELSVVDEQVLFRQAWRTEIRGAELADPVNDPLPRDAYDRRVIDQDADGCPGLTISVDVPDVVGGDAYVVHRLRYRLDGRQVDNDTISGTIEWTSEQNVILATDAVLMMSFNLPADPETMRHRFLMVRVDDSWTCETLRAEWPSLLAKAREEAA